MVLDEDDVGTLTVNGCVDAFDVGSLINGPADNTGSRDVSNMLLGVYWISMLSDTGWGTGVGVGVDLSMPPFWRLIMLSGNPVSGSTWKFTKDGGMFEVVVTVDELWTTPGDVVEETCEVARFECKLVQVLEVSDVCALGVDVKPLGTWCEFDPVSVCIGCKKLADWWCCIVCKSVVLLWGWVW